MPAKHCPQCGYPMSYGKSNEGIAFFSCTNPNFKWDQRPFCGYSELVETTGYVPTR